LDEGSLRERKLKKFEEFKQRKLREEQERKLNQRDKSHER